MSASFDPKFIKFATIASGTLKNGLLAYWTLDQNSATQNDEIGTNHLTVVGATYYSATSKLGYAIDFTTNTNYLIKYGTLAISSDTATISLWARFDTLVDSTLIRLVDSQDGQAVCKIGMYSSGEVEGYFRDTAHANYNCSAASGAVSTGAWYHIMIINYGNGLNPKMFINNVDVTVANSAFSGALNTGLDQIVIGNDYDGGAVAPDGQIDEVGVWNRALTLTERTALYNSGSGKAYSSF